jgi:hypothetical protein
LRRLEGSDDWVYPLGRTWDPTAEICDDGVDNTGNGKVDCRDASCKGTKICRKEIPGKLQLFVMSQCPYAIRTLAAVNELLSDFGKRRKAIDFSIEYIGNNRDGTLTSMHGQGEVDEDLRQICAQKHYSRNYAFMDYVICRNEAYEAHRNSEEPDAWKDCATGAIKARVIERCAEGPEGKKLLEASFARAEKLGITGSPTWLLNNKHDMSGRTPDAIKEGFCAMNQKRKGCR